MKKKESSSFLISCHSLNDLYVCMYELYGTQRRLQSFGQKESLYHFVSNGRGRAQ